jgi:excisionase family DNA binding protein
MTGFHGTSAYGESRTPPPLLTITDVRQLLGISRTGVYGLIDAGELTVVYIGARVRFEPSEVTALIARGRTSRRAKTETAA